MLRIVILCGLLFALCQQALVTAHVLGRTYSASDLARLKSLLEQFEETLGAEEAAESPPDYQDARLEAEHNPATLEWDRERASQAQPSDDRAPEEGYRAQQNRLQDLLMSTRSKTLSACFGARIDRIGTSSGLGCSSPKRG